MKRLLFTLLLAAFCATGHAQTIKSLGYNTVNGQVVYTGTNVLTFTNQVSVGDSQAIIGSGNGVLFFFDQDGTKDIFGFDGGEPDVARARANLGLGATWLTNTNVTNFRTAIGLGASNSVSFNDLRIDELIIDGENGIGFENEDGKANTRSALGLPLPALTNTSNVTMMRALAGSTNTNEPFSGTIQFVDGNNVDIYIYVTNGIITGWAD
jgi:hypothetical protein